MPLIPLIAGSLAVGAAFDHFKGGGGSSTPGRAHFVPIEDDHGEGTIDDVSTAGDRDAD